MSTVKKSSAIRTQSHNKVRRGIPHTRPDTPRSTAARSLTQFARGFLPKKDAFGLVDIKDSCGICRQLPEASGEKWCALPCGHRFGHRCLRALLAHRRLRHCPVCNDSVARVCGHPVAPAPVRAAGVGVLAEVRRVARGLQAQMRTECGFCRDQRARCEDAARVLAALELNADRAHFDMESGVRTVPEDQFEREWREWWDETTEEPPSLEEFTREKEAYPHGLYLV